MLLLAAAPAGRHRLVDAASALPALAAVRPELLTGTGAARVVELVDPADPQVVLVRLRSAAAAPGPLLIHLIGQLTVDRKQQRPHLALARTTSATARYTALPWHWLSAELGHRRPGTTTVLADLVADSSAGERLPELLASLAVTGAAVYGAVTPPPERRTPAEPRYSRAVAELLRTATARPDPAELHDLAAARAGLPPGALLLTPRPTGAAGPGTPVSPVPPAAARQVPPSVPQPPPPFGAVPTPASRPGAHPDTGTPGAAPPAGERQDGHGSSGAPSAGDAVYAVLSPLTAQAAPAPGPSPVQPPPPVSPGGTPAGAAPAGAATAGAPAEAGGQARSADRERPFPPPAPRQEPGRETAAASHPAPDARPGTAQEPPAGAPAPAAPPAAPASPAAPAPGPPAPAPSPAEDPHPAILAAAHAGRHSEAAAMAAAWEQHAWRAHGPDSAEAVHWLEVRADLARLAGDPARSCELWLSAATARLSAGEEEAAADVVAAVDRAHHCWEQVRDGAAARGLSERLATLRRRVPGRRPGAVEALERRIEALSSASAS
ncbi:hypothetical protein HCK00_19395 [Streptomyces sp. PLAI1-29]|uniref:Uncharacterized protein n=1 Tax=Streptomyces zingiberis TaxID=2053010 RepID=A0ABX1C3Z7_9ACTN|nr:hypothetical protein [Streptomyces zingiberis]